MKRTKIKFLMMVWMLAMTILTLMTPLKAADPLCNGSSDCNCPGAMEETSGTSGPCEMNGESCSVCDSGYTYYCSEAPGCMDYSAWCCGETNSCTFCCTHY